MSNHGRIVINYCDCSECKEDGIISDIQYRMLIKFLKEYKLEYHEYV